MTATTLLPAEGSALRLDPQLLDRIHRLWDELAGFEAADSDAARDHLLKNVAELVDAQNAYWVGAVRVTDDERDPMLGWRPRLIRYLQPLLVDESFTQRRIKEIGRGELDELSCAHPRFAGSYRSVRMCDLVSPAWFSSETYARYVAQGVHDSLVAVAPVSPMAEAYYGFLRMRPNAPFTEAERQIALYAMRGLTWFHRQVLLAHGLLVARAPLSPMERRVLAQLLTDASEKMIAAELGVADSTLHGYVRDVLRKFGVSGRTGLTSLWLGRQA